MLIKYKKSSNIISFKFNGHEYKLLNYTIGLYSDLLNKYTDKDIIKIFNNISEIISNNFGFAVYDKFILQFLDSSLNKYISKFYLTQSSLDFEKDPMPIINLFSKYILDKYKVDQSNSLELTVIKIKKLINENNMDYLLTKINNSKIQDSLLSFSEDFNYDKLKEYLLSLDSNTLYKIDSILNKYE